METSHVTPIWLPDDGIEKFTRFGFEHNPNLRVTVQEYWLPNDTFHPVYPLETKVKVDHNAFGLFVSGANGVQVSDSSFSDNQVNGVVLHRYVTNGAITRTT